MARPNFIVFLTDDQGYGDLSCMGATDFRTPHLDRMAREGARFTDWYSNSPVCSPARAALLTGRFPGNAGVRSILAGHRTATGLPGHVPTIATALKGLGYRTYMSGKWHLGLADESRPQNHGFDHWYGFMAGCIDYYSHIFYWGMNRRGPGMNPTHDLWEDDREVWQDGTYFTEAIASKAIDYIREAAGREEPFFLYVPFNAPHYPMHAPEKYKGRFPDLPWDRQIMAAMISAVDDGVGEIMAEVERLGLGDSTCAFFTADNGPSRESRNWLDGNQDPYYGGTTGKLKGHKFSLYEGGIRVPGIMHWPGTIPGGQVLSEPCASMDVFPTILSAAGGDASGYELNGTSLLPYVADGTPPAERDIYWEMNKQTAVRRGPWKLVLNGQLVEGAPAEDAVHLANLQDDMGEVTNLASGHPELVDELTACATAWRDVLEKRWRNEFTAEESGTVTH
ncbi:MAG: sulfatase-like hydrolase/transferase [Lentisphaerae bacterium]|nr:sulfatase-like hydrolase/transferase [Lentisphaerota bacterium]MBT4818832.1 sulfatase-like hydrolase/transferase [Lentisphaerota bacterium]MBT5612895.1 sulfatase-like hydrolase/transferase [Lentisphaerota bacterium]MBT7060959.1 sulfatase-like hydrolase/transferase [Lentisphaerota bacterium]MBT7846984.1 sulfatase-like hydrolase/transferase [Lentisphaerota bacterium]